MFRKFVLASVAAVSLGVGALGGSTEASANPWSGYGGPHHGYYGGPPPWARAWGWRRHRHYWGHEGQPWGGPPVYGRPVPPAHYGQPYATPQPHAYAPSGRRGYDPY